MVDEICKWLSNCMTYFWIQDYEETDFAFLDQPQHKEKTFDRCVTLLSNQVSEGIKLMFQHISLLEMTSVAGKCVLNLEQNDGSEHSGLALWGYTEPSVALKSFHIRSTVDSALYLSHSRSNNFTGAVYCYSKQSGVGAVLEHLRQSRLLLWFWLVQLLNSLLISTKHFSVGFLR